MADETSAADELTAKPEALPAPDFTAQIAVDQPVTATRTYPVRQPEADKKDFLIQVHASTLARCRRKLTSVRGTRFSWAELLIGLATLAAGASLGAVASGIELSSSRGVLFYVIFPPITVGCLVAYGFVRYRNLANPTEVIKEVLDELPDPDKTT